MPTGAALAWSVAVLQEQDGGSGDALRWLAFGIVLVPVLILLVGTLLLVPALTALRNLVRRLRR